MPYDESQPGYIAMGWALVGSPKLKSLKNVKSGGLRSFATFEKAWADRAYKVELYEIATGYKEVVADAFNRAHGRTGATAETAKAFYEGAARGGGGILPTQVISVRFQGGIGFVVNPIQSHTITAHNAKWLSNWNTAPYRGETYRTKHFYSEFPDAGNGPGTAAHLASVEWFQGGEESFSPDRSWFESGPARAVLEVESRAAMSRLAAHAKVLWSDEMSGYAVIASGKKTFIPMPRE